MERLAQPRPEGISANSLHNWGLLFLTLGTVSRGLIQNRLLHLSQLTTMELLEAMQTSQNVMIYTTVALILQAMETCAVPIFAFLLVEGVQRTANFRAYMVRILGLAALTEIPYNLAMSGKILDFSGINPVFGLVLGIVMLYFFLRYPDKSLKHRFIRIVVACSAVIWCFMLKVEYGASAVMIIAVLWIFRKKPLLRNLAGATVALLSSVSSLLYIAAPMGFLAVHFYNGEREEQGRLRHYLPYPLILLAVYVIGMIL